MADKRHNQNYEVSSPNTSISSNSMPNLVNAEQLFSPTQHASPIASHSQLPQMQQYSQQFQMAGPSYQMLPPLPEFQSSQNLTAPLNPNNILPHIPMNSNMQPSKDQNWNQVKNELDMRLQTRPTPFTLVRDKILNVDPIFNNIINKDPTFELMDMKMKEFRKYARLKYFSLQQDGSFKKPEIVNPTGYSDIIEQQKIITEYECRRAKIIDQAKGETRNRISQIIYNFSNLLCENLATMTVRELKSELQKYKLKMTGPKLSMVQRMIQYFENSSKDLLENFLEKDFLMASSISSFSTNDFTSVCSMPNTETQSELMTHVENYEQEHMGNGLDDEDDLDFLNKVFFKSSNPTAEPPDSEKRMSVSKLVESFEAHHST